MYCSTAQPVKSADIILFHAAQIGLKVSMHWIMPLGLCPKKISTKKVSTNFFKEMQCFRHSLGGEVIFLALQHFIAPALE